MKLDLTKPVETSDGNPVRIIAADRKHSNYSIVALVDLGRHEVVDLFNSEGQSSLTTRRLMNVRKRETLFVNVFAAADDEAFFFSQYSSEEAAALSTARNLMSRAVLTIEDGEIVSVKTLYKKP